MDDVNNFTHFQSANSMNNNKQNKNGIMTMVFKLSKFCLIWSSCEKVGKFFLPTGKIFTCDTNKYIIIMIVNQITF